MSDLDRNLASPLEGEGLRGDGVAKWYVVHTYSAKSMNTFSMPILATSSLDSGIGSEP